jgi:hypothetical protein
LQDIYELDIPYNINDYLFTCKTRLQQLDTSQTNHYTREKLLVSVDEQGLNLSLYLDQNILDHFTTHNPLERIDQHNVQEFCLALEGISHFLYLAWNASYDRSVTLLEMEIQAEVDKFIMLMNYLEQQSNLPESGQLTSLLFRSNVYHDDLSQAEQQRYRDASGYAKTYCQHLERHFFGKHNRAGLLAELRRFYRQTQAGKLKQIGRPH